MMVLTNSVEGRDEEFNDWYSETHLKDVLNLEGFASAQRFKVKGLTESAPYQYLAIYELDTEDPDKAIKALTDAMGAGMVISDAMDKKLDAWTCAPLTQKITG